MLSRHIRGLKKPSLGAITTTALVASSVRSLSHQLPSPWGMDIGFGQEQRNKRVQRAPLSRQAEVMRVPVPASLVLHSAGRANGASAPAAAAPRPLAPADTTRKATRHTWLGPSPTHMQPSQCKTMPEPWSSFCPTPQASASAQWHHHHHHPWTMTLGWSLPERDKANACCLPLLHCSTALVMDPRGRNLWALGYNTATCCRDAFPPHGMALAWHVMS